MWFGFFIVLKTNLHVKYFIFPIYVNMLICFDLSPNNFSGTFSA